MKVTWNFFVLQNFWNDLMMESKKWGLIVYEQVCMSIVCAVKWCPYPPINLAKCCLQFNHFMHNPTSTSQMEYCFVADMADCPTVWICRIGWMSSSMAWMQPSVMCTWRKHGSDRWVMVQPGLESLSSTVCHHPDLHCKVLRYLLSHR